MSISKSDLGVFKGLSIVRIDGFEPEKQWVELDDGTRIDDTPSDPPGSANWFCDQYGMQRDGFDPEYPGILWTDYDCGADDPWAFTLLIDTDEIADLMRFAGEAGYEILGTSQITEPCHYGDGAGVVTILKHPDGWCVVS